ncbi:cadherin-12-like [Aplochiton taeniatus]
MGKEHLRGGARTKAMAWPHGRVRSLRGGAEGGYRPKGEDWSQEEVRSLRGGVRGGARPRRRGQESGQRVKRGWVWNQFFVLEEYMGSEPQYIGKLHSDTDRGDSGVKYTLSGEGAGSIFTIDQSTGDIHALEALDREEKSFYTLRAQAVDRVKGHPVEPESQFIIKVQDINDNEPRFLDGPYTASVPEMSPGGTFVTQVTATDADDPTYGNSARIVYSILQGQPYFSVDSRTGVVRTALANMDREVREVYQVVIQAKDMGGQLGGLAGTTSINITLSDINDNPPRFPKSVFHLRVPESSVVGSVVGRIHANDPDVGQNAQVVYSIVPGDEGGVFDISTQSHSQEGVVVLKKTLDYEVKKSYTFKVEASNPQVSPRSLPLGPFKDTSTVKVSVLDADEPPVFTRHAVAMDVYEDTPPGSIIGSVTAQDLDSSSSAVRYSLTWKQDSDSCFDIDTVEGTISINEFLDRETTSQHNITVEASKVSDPTLSAMAMVTVNVLDVNEFPPELSGPFDTFVCEDTRVGQVIQTVSAVDRDQPPMGQRFFYKAPKEIRNRNFTVRDFGNNTAGVVTRRAGFQRRVQELYFLPVVVEDSGYPAQSSTCTLTIRVCACQGHGSLLSCTAGAVYLPIGLSTGAVLSILLCLVILMVMGALYISQRRQKERETLMSSKEDIRDNVVHYDDEGGGEADTQAFDMGTLRSTHTRPSSSTATAKQEASTHTHSSSSSSSVTKQEASTHTHSSSSSSSVTKQEAKKKKGGYGNSVLPHLRGSPDTARPPSVHLQSAADGRVTRDDSEAIREFIEQRLEESHLGFSSPPYDSLATYAYEGEGSIAESLSSIDQSWLGEGQEDFGNLGDWGPPFRTLAAILVRDGTEAPQTDSGGS